MTAGPIEIEAKFRVLDESILEEIGGADTVAGMTALEPLSGPTRYEDHYIDTPDRHLRRAGWTLRLRKVRGGTLGSLKRTAPPAGAVFTRDEIEHPAANTTDPDRWPESPVAVRARELIAGRIPERIVAVRQDRCKRSFSHGSSRLELSIDRVEAVLPDGRVIDSWVEVELELEHGDPAIVDRVAAIMGRRRALRAETIGKGERAIDAAHADATRRVRVRAR
jgi:inorganic triphosphatase YgiF